MTAADSKYVRLSAKLISRIYAQATENHLVENRWRGTGIPNVKRHGPHSVRHIRGTTVVKKTGSFQLAGDANQNSEKTARKYYTRFLPENRVRRVNDILFKKEDRKKQNTSRKNIPPRETGNVK